MALLTADHPPLRIEKRRGPFTIAVKQIENEVFHRNEGRIEILITLVMIPTKGAATDALGAVQTMPGRCEGDNVVRLRLYGGTRAGSVVSRVIAGLREVSAALFGRAVRRPSRVFTGNTRIALAKQSSGKWSQRRVPAVRAASKHRGPSSRRGGSRAGRRSRRRLSRLPATPWPATAAVRAAVRPGGSTRAVPRSWRRP